MYTLKSVALLSASVVLRSREYKVAGTGEQTAPQPSNLNVVLAGMVRYHPRAHERRVSRASSVVKARNAYTFSMIDCCKSCIGL